MLFYSTIIQCNKVLYLFGHNNLLTPCNIIQVTKYFFCLFLFLQTPPACSWLCTNHLSCYVCQPNILYTIDGLVSSMILGLLPHQDFRLPFLPCDILLEALLLHFCTLLLLLLYCCTFQLHFTQLCYTVHFFWCLVHFTSSLVSTLHHTRV